MQDIIKKLKTLKSIAPSAEWKKSSRQLLMMAIKGNVDTGAAGVTWAQELAKILFPWKVLRLAARPALTLVSILSLVLASGLSVSASDVALPGDALYPLKIASEKVQVALTFKQDEQAKIHVELAGRRINEVQKIQENSLPSEHKSQKMNVAIDKFQEEITAVKTKLENLQNKATLQETAEVAKIVDTKADEYQVVLTETNSLPEVSGEVTENINQGLILVGELSKQAKELVQIAAASEEALAAPELNAPCVDENCDVNLNANSNTNTDLTNTEQTEINTNTTGETLENVNINTNVAPQKVYIKPVSTAPTNTNTVVPPEVDESTLKVGIDLRQEPTTE